MQYLNEHKSNEHPTILFECDECDLKVSNGIYLEAHKKRKHSTERTFICSICCDSFQKKKSLKNHEEKVHSTTTVECPKCAKLFSHKDNLTTHLKYHDDSQQLKCEHCGKGFVSSQKLKEHINTHTGEKPFKCKSKDCLAVFGSSSALSHHKKSCSSQLEKSN